MARTAIVLGATGMVGKELVQQLLDHAEYEQVRIIHRRKISEVHPKLVQYEINMDKMEKYAEHFKGDDLFCCLGTTIKKAKNNEQYRKVDLEYPVKAAEIAVNNDVPNYLIITAMGADKDSYFFYNRLKGETEEAIKQFHFKKIGIFRPAQLDGDRQETRVGEQFALKAMKLFSFLMVGKLKKYRPIHAKAVAAGMIYLALNGTEGIHIIDSGEINELAKRSQQPEPR